MRLRLSRAERQSRAVMGMAPRHPERLTGELPAAQEDWLTAAAEEMWPQDEYTEIILVMPVPASSAPAPGKPRHLRRGMRRARFTPAERREYLAALDIPGDRWTPCQRRLACRFDEAAMSARTVTVWSTGQQRLIEVSRLESWLGYFRYLIRHPGRPGWVSIPAGSDRPEVPGQ